MKFLGAHFPKIARAVLIPTVAILAFFYLRHLDLRMIGRTPRACRTNVCGDGRVLLALVRNVYNVRHGWSAAAARTACAP